MSLQVQGKSGELQEVDKFGSAQVDGLTPYARAARRGDAWSASAAPADIDTTDTILAVRNDGQRIFYVHSIVAGSDAVGEITIHRPSAAYTSAGSAVVETSLSDTLKTTDELTCHGDESANVQGEVITSYPVVASGSREIVYGGALFLKGGQAIAIDIVGEPTLCFATVHGWFEDA
ncbi:MAG: hypothetical protein V3V96_15395 [Acidiferrobacterales bacterium]